MGVDCLRAQGLWIFLPAWVEVAISLDGERWATAGRVDVPLENDPDRAAERIEVDLSQGRGVDPARFLRVHARAMGPLPEWHQGAPEHAWLFVDEIVAEGD